MFAHKSKRCIQVELLRDTEINGEVIPASIEMDDGIELATNTVVGWSDFIRLKELGAVRIGARPVNYDIGIGPRRQVGCGEDAVVYLANGRPAYSNPLISAC